MGISQRKQVFPLVPYPSLTFIIVNNYMDFQTQKKILQPILKDPRNHLCADCSSVSPTWASLDFGVFLCSNCSGAHRGLGPTITRVKSANLDLWQQEWIKNMLIGNEELNAYWQSDARCYEKKPKNGSSNQEIGRYVYEKYIKKKYVKDSSVSDPLTALKNNNYNRGEVKPVEKRTEIKKPPKIEVKEKISVAQTKPKVTENLLDFDFDPQPSHDHPTLLVQQPNIEHQIEPPKIYLNQNLLQENNGLSQNFTDGTDIGTSFTTQNSKEQFMSFDEMLNFQKQQAPPLQHSMSSQQVNRPILNIHHPYNPHIAQNNLVYNSYFQTNNQQFNAPHSPQPQIHHFQHLHYPAPATSVYGAQNMDPSNWR